MHKFLCLFFISFLFCCTQNTIEDDISRIAKLHEKAKNTVNDSTLLYITEAKKLIDKNKKLPDTLTIENIFRKGYYFKQINQLDSASYYFHRTIDLIKAPNIRLRNRVYFQNTWQTDEVLGNYKNAISAAQKFIEISNQEDNTNDILFAYNALQRMYYDLGNIEKELEYNNLASDYALKSNDMHMYVVTKGHSAIIMLRDLNKPKEAFALVDSLKTIRVGIDAKRQLYRTMGILNYYNYDIKNAIKYYDKSHELSKQIELNRDNNLLESHSNLAEAYFDLSEYIEAKKHLDSAKVYITPNSPQDLINFYDELFIKTSIKTNQDPVEVATHFNTLVTDMKRQYEEKINDELTALKLSYQKEELAIAQKNKADLDKLKLLGLSGVLGLSIIIGYLIYRQRQFRFEKTSLKMQQRLLRSQLNPHFMFNTLSVIQNQIEKDGKNAANYLLKFSRLLRLILENSLNDFVQIEDELESLRKYLDLQLMRFPSKFDYTIRLANFEEDDLLFIPPMLIQPFVENSIEHGFLGIDYKGQIDVTLTLQDKYIFCTIEDNGVGIKATNSKVKKSISVNLISKFILKTTKQNISITDKGLNMDKANGVLVKFLIPFKLSEHD